MRERRLSFDALEDGKPAAASAPQKQPAEQAPRPHAPAAVTGARGGSLKKLGTHYLLSDTDQLPHWGQGLYALLFSLALSIALVLIPERDPSDHPAKTPTGVNLHAPAKERRLEDLPVRVLLRLEQAEQNELNPHLRDDIRIAWITVHYAHHGHAQPAIDATYRVLGLHPDKVWPSIVGRRRAALGAAYDRVYDAAGNLRPGGWQQWVIDGVGAPSSPKKPVQSVRLVRKRNSGEAA